MYLFICVYFCIYVCMGVYSKVYMDVGVRGQCFTEVKLPCVLRQGLLLAWSEYVLPNQCLDRKHTTPAWCSHMASTDWAQTLMFAWRELCQVIHVHIINHQWPNETIVRRKRGEVHWFCKSNYDKVTNERKHQIKCVRGMKKSE